MHPDIIPKRRLENIVSRVIKALDGQVQQRNYSKIFDNCILTCLYLLKRRRYDKDFLNSESDEAMAIERMLNNLIKRRANSLTARQCKIISVTIKFLKKEASWSDLDESVLTEGG